MLIVEERGNPECPVKSFPEQSIEPTTKSAHI